MFLYPRATWRLLDSGRANGRTNMAIDEALLEAVIKGESPPVLRFYAWEPACLSLGIGQQSKLVDWAACAQRGWEVVRRTTGGRAILHTDELTYSVCAPLTDPRVTGSIQESYARLSQALAQGITLMGLPVCATPAVGMGDPAAAKGPVCFDTPANYEITIGERKLIGSAQMRRHQVMLQHGTLPLNGDITRIVEALAYPSEQARAQARVLLRTQAATFEDGLGRAVSYETAVTHMTAAFTDTLNLELMPSTLTPKETARAAELWAEKYGHDSWTKRR